MTLRELMVERILFIIDEEDLIKDYKIKEDEVAELSDIDLLELYEDVHGLNDEYYSNGS